MSYYAAFLSHKQGETGDRCAGIHLESHQRGVKVWYDMRQEELTAATMKKGVEDSSRFVLFASKGYLDSWFCRIELIQALVLNKPIVLLIDPVMTNEWAIVEGNDFVDKLYVKIKNDDGWPNLSLEDFQIRLKDVVVFRYVCGSPLREEMLRSILPSGTQLGAPVRSPNPSIILDNIVIVGHPTNGRDQCELIALGLQSVDVSAYTLVESFTGLETLLKASKDRNFAVVVFLTKDLFSQSHVLPIIKFAKMHKKEIVPVFEADSRRTGAFSFGDLKNSTKEPDLHELLERDCIEFSQYDRKSEKFKVAIRQIASKCGFPPLFQSVTDFDAFDVAGRKAREMEIGTRTGLQENIAKSCSVNPCCILVGEAGMGKSTLMAHIAETRCSHFARRSGLTVQSTSNQVGAIHFFSYSNFDSTKISTCMLSLGRQLCSSLPGFRSCLPGNLKGILEDASAMRNVKDQAVHLFREIIFKPCRKVESEFKPERTILLLDALDECENTDALTEAIYDLWAETSDSSELGKAPSWLVLLASTRPLFTAKQILGKYDNISFTPTDEENRKDIRQYAETRIRKWMPNSPNIEVVSEAVAEKSNGLFLWLSYSMKELKTLADKGELNLARVSEMPKGLTGIYKTYFERLYNSFPDNEKYYRALAIGLIAPRSPLPEKIWMRACGYSSVSLNDRNTYREFKNSFSSLLVFDESLDVLRAPHKSMVDFLSSSPDETGLAQGTTAESAGFPHLAVEATAEHHALIARALDETFITAEQKRKLWEMGPVKDYDDDYALTNIVYHLRLSGNLVDAVFWYVEMRRLIRRIDKAVRDGDLQRIMEEGNQLLEEFEKVASLPALSSSTTTKVMKDLWHSANEGGPILSSLEIQQKTLKLSLEVLELSVRALLEDARMLPGQILGRIDIPLDDNMAQSNCVNAARMWLDNVKRENGPSIATPVNIRHSGLNRAGTGIIRRFVHEEGVWAVAIGSNGYVCVASGKIVYVYTKSGRVHTQLRGHSSYVTSVAISSDSKWIVTGSGDNTAIIWDLQSGNQVNTLEGRSDTVTSVAISSDSKWIVTGSWDNTAIIWDLQSGNQMKTLEGHSQRVESVAISSDSKWIVTGSYDYTAIIWESESGNQVKELQHSSIVTSVAISSDSNGL